MLVDRYRIRLPEGNSTGTTINIPVDMTFQIVDQSEIIERDFVKNEVEAAINPILDYEKVRFSPATSVTATFHTPIQRVIYDLNFLSGSTGYYQNNNTTQTSFQDIGFVNDDIKFRKNGLVKSMLRLDFYDSDILTNQRLLFFIIIRPKVTQADVTPPNNNAPYVQNYSANLKMTRFNLNNTITQNTGNSEGIFIYDYKDEVGINAPKEVYMRATFNNAKTGLRTRFMTDYDPTNIAWPIDTFVEKIFTKYVLHRTINGNFYQIDTTYSNNVSIVLNNTYNIKLYEVAVT
jgi:hypothetical protein